MISRLFAAIMLMVLASSLNAQAVYPTVFPSPILLLDREKMFSEAKLGQAMLALEVRKRDALIQENSQIDQKFEAEELELVTRRSEVSSGEFQVLSNDFDRRVQDVRDTQQSKGIALQQEAEQSRLRFFVITAPYMSQILQKYQASAILDHRTVLLFSVDMDITDEAVILLDKAFEDNPDMVLEEEQ